MNPRETWCDRKIENDHTFIGHYPSVVIITINVIAVDSNVYVSLAVDGLFDSTPDPTWGQGDQGGRLVRQVAETANYDFNTFC